MFCYEGLCHEMIMFQVWKGLLYRIGLPSNTATPLALFVRIEPLCVCSCIHQQAYGTANTAIAAQIIIR